MKQASKAVKLKLLQHYQSEEDKPQPKTVVTFIKQEERKEAQEHERL